MGDRLGQVVEAVDLGRATLSKIKANLVWALAYNALGIPLAAGKLVLLCCCCCARCVLRLGSSSAPGRGSRSLPACVCACVQVRCCQAMAWRSTRAWRLP